MTDDADLSPLSFDCALFSFATALGVIALEIGSFLSAHLYIGWVP